MKSIICVDDSSFILKYLKSVLPKKINNPSNPATSYNFEFIDNPLEAIDLIKEMRKRKEEVVMVISDYNMPPMNGLDFLKKIKPLIPGAKLVLLTDSEKLDLAINAVNSNVLDRFMIKGEIKENEEFTIGLKNLLNAYQIERIVESQREQMAKTIESQRQQLIHANQMVSVGTMAAGVAHEINNPLNIATGDIHMVRRDISDLVELINLYLKIKLPPEESVEIEKLKKKIDLTYLLDHLDDKPSRCEGALKRIQEIVKNLRTFTHLDTGELAAIDINKSIESALKLISEKEKQGVEIKTEFAELPSVSCSGREINQMFMNILLNALQAMKGKGLLRVMTLLENDKHVVAKISDTGPGIPEDNLKRVFEPFFTTKPIGEGTGLGLSTSYSVIEKHGGEITVANNPDKGALFTVRLLKEGTK